MSNSKSTIIGLICLIFASQGHGQEYVPGEVIVKFRNQGQGAQFSSKAMGASFSVKKSWGSLGMGHFKAKKGQTQDTEQLVEQLKNDPNVEFVEPNYILRKQSAGIEGEPLSLEHIQSLKQQNASPGFSKSNSGSSVSTFSSSYIQSNAPILIEEAWGILTGGSHIPVVAVIDTGVDYNHYVFVDTDAIWHNQDEIPNNGIDDDGNGYIDDVRGWNFVKNNNNPMDDENHGTHVAGIVLGVTQDIFATNLQPAKVKIMPLKFLDDNGSGATSDAIEAIYYAIENGASIINASWGGGGYSLALQEAIIQSYNNKMTFAAAAGNLRMNNDSSPTYPANYAVPSLISVAATTDSDTLASFSNFGKQTVHIASPGVSILSTLPNGTFAYASGTSMATPLLAGIVALMEYQAGEPVNGYQMSQILFGSNDSRVGNVTGKVITDARVNAYKAVSYIKTNGASDYQPGYTAVNRYLASGGGDEGGGGCGMVRKIVSGTGSSGADLFGRALLMLIVLSPFVLAMVLKQRRREDENRRSHQRYSITSEVRISVGDKELVGSVSSISLGGVKINTEALLEQGGILEMNILSPDGKEKVQVLGKVVWSQERKSYGVQFCDMAETQTASISGWTKKLVKSS